MNKRIRRLYTLLFAGVMLPLLSFGQQQEEKEKELAPVSRSYAIVNANVIQGPGRNIGKATVVVKNGLITAVGKGIAIPPDAIQLKGDSLYVYPGFIDGLTRNGLTKPKEDPNQNKERPKDPGNPTPEAAGITPYNDVRLTLNPTEKTLDDFRALGFTVAHVVPYGGMLPGSSSLVLYSGKTPDEMILNPKNTFYSELTPAQRVYPNTVIGVMSKWRELHKQASLARAYEASYASNPAGLNRPVTNRITEAFYPVIDKKLPVMFEADKYLKLQRIFTLQNEFGFPLMVGDVKEGWDAIQKIKATNTKVFLSLDLPEDKTFEVKVDKKEQAKKDSLAKAEKKYTAEREALEKRKTESIKQYTAQAVEFQKAGIPFGFSTLTVKPADVQKNLRRMIAAGLTEDQALAALTTSPAQLLGLSDRVGTIDPGKIANLVLSDKPYFKEKSKVKFVFVDGVLYPYESKEPAKGDAGAVNIAGTWTMTSETPEGKFDEKVTFVKEGTSYTGSITGGRFKEAATLENISVTGNKLKFSYTTQAGQQSIKVDVEGTIEADAFKGTASAGSAGSYAVTGKKDPSK
jgi:hypothetical protein